MNIQVNKEEDTDIFSVRFVSLPQEALGKAEITVNKNGIPFDTQKPMVTSGIRVGTPAVTARGMKESEMVVIAKLISKVLDNKDNDAVIAEAKKEVHALAEKFPLYKK